ncbi:MAG: hypothetical protein IJ764_01620, partial [Bacteroidales bacterium]|nr:hypothetical protein [Bacteroidales bacterium]
MNKFAKAILFLGLWAMISVSLGAQQRYASEQIRRLAEKLQVPASLHDGVNYKVAQYAGHPVTITCQGKEITHIGYSLFTPMQRQLIGSAHCDFIERLLMASDIKDFFGTSIDRYLREEKITFDKGSLQALKSLCSDTSFNIQITLQDERQYVFNWYVGNRRIVTVSYPNNYQLVTGFTMQELEARIAPALRATQVSATTPFRPVESMFQKMSNGGIYVFAGDIYMLPQLTSNRYYVKHPDGSFHVLYSKDFPAETMANLVTATDIDNALEMEILMVRYGHVKEALRVPLRQC